MTKTFQHNFPISPLFMWAGGKRRLIKDIIPLFPKSSEISAYVEPFFGGGAVFGHVISAYSPNDIRINDCNTEIMQIYYEIKTDPNGMVLKINELQSKWLGMSKTERKAYYYSMRDQYWSSKQCPDSTRILYFLMKTSFNGIWQTCNKSKGKFATPVGLCSQSKSFIDEMTIQRWSEALTKVVMTSVDFSKVDVPDGALVYCDPPYRGSFTNYSTGFNDNDQKRLIDWCRHLSSDKHCRVILSNRDTGDSFFEKLCKDAIINKIPIVYTAGRRKITEDGFKAKPATELLISWGNKQNDNYSLDEKEAA